MDICRIYSCNQCLTLGANMLSRKGSLKSSRIFQHPPRAVFWIPSPPAGLLSLTQSDISQQPKRHTRAPTASTPTATCPPTANGFNGVSLHPLRCCSSRLRLMSQIVSFATSSAIWTDSYALHVCYNPRLY